MASATRKTVTVDTVTLVLDAAESQALRDLLGAIGGYSEFRKVTVGILEALVNAGFDLDLDLYRSEDWPLIDENGERISIHPRGGTPETYTTPRLVFLGA